MNDTSENKVGNMYINSHFSGPFPWVFTIILSCKWEWPHSLPLPLQRPGQLEVTHFRLCCWWAVGLGDGAPSAWLGIDGPLTGPWCVLGLLRKDVGLGAFRGKKPRRTWTWGVRDPRPVRPAHLSHLSGPYRCWACSPCSKGLFFPWTGMHFPDSSCCSDATF